ncbi:MAG: hypothetical protein LBH01_08840 [Verrucomicrobiales bacterium]|jgi:hypothetical protein|nr:hypothetical protein [Verrucomicrobiales bacterium]
MMHESPCFAKPKNRRWRLDAIGWDANSKHIVIINLLPVSRFILSLLLLFLPAGASFAANTDLAATTGEPGLSLSNLRSVDVMKYTKDVMTHQPDDARIASLIAALKSLHITHIAIAIPLDADEDYPAGDKPAPRSARDFTQKWADAIHAQGLHVLWRGTWSGLEGLYHFPKRVGNDRFPAGTAKSAPTDGNATWLGKTYRYIVEHPGFFANGDLWAPLPERTEYIFQDATSFLPHDGGIQQNYTDFFRDLKQVSESAFAKIGKQVRCGLSANNYTEVKNGWLPQEFFDAQGVIVVDYYGSSRTPEELEADIRQMHARYGKPVFIQEWSDFWHSQTSLPERSAYLRQIYARLQKLANDGILVGFNYWGGWDNTTESIVVENETGFHLNYRGKLLQEFFKQCGKAAAQAD